MGMLMGTHGMRRRARQWPWTPADTARSAGCRWTCSLSTSTDLPQAGLGSRVELSGQQVLASDVTPKRQHSPRQLFCNLRRVPLFCLGAERLFKKLLRGRPCCALQTGSASR